MRVLATGATGFIGRRLVESLCGEGLEVRAISRHASVGDLIRRCPSGSIVPLVADLTRTASLEGICANVEAVFHLAGYAHASDTNDRSAALIHRQVTVEGTRLLLEQACRSGVGRFIFVSSVKAMGEGGEECLEETVAASPVTEYGQAKLEAEQLVMAAGRDCGMHVCVLRLPMVYGPGVKGNLLHMIGAIDRGRFPPLSEVNNRRSMVHADDVVAALRLAMEHARAGGEIYLVTDGRAYSTRDIYVLICRALGRAIPSWTVPAATLRAAALTGDVIGRMRGRPFFFNSIALDKLLGSAWYSSDKIERELGFKPMHTFETALPAMLEEYRKRGRTA